MMKNAISRSSLRNLLVTNNRLIVNPIIKNTGICPFSTVPRLQQSPSAIGDNTLIEKKAKRPVGGFRGGIFGFFLGASLASAYGFYYLIEEYQKSSTLVLNSISDLEKTGLTVRDYIKRVDVLQNELNELKSKVAYYEQVEEVKALCRSHLNIGMKQINDLRNDLSRIEMISNDLVPVGSVKPDSVEEEEFIIVSADK